VNSVGGAGPQMYRKIINSRSEISILPEIKCMTLWKKNITGLIIGSHCNNWYGGIIND